MQRRGGFAAACAFLKRRKEVQLSVEILPKWNEPAIRVLMMPRDTNAQGTIFGGVVLSYIDQAGAILSSTYLNFGDEADYVLCIDTQLTLAEQAEPLRAHFLFVPDMVSLRVILRALRLA